MQLSSVTTTITFGLGMLVITAACSPRATITCSSGLTPCGSACVNITNDPFNCGACGNVCKTGDQCNGTGCTNTPCVATGAACTVDSECCTLYCGADSFCACIPANTAGCVVDSDCCSASCNVATATCN